MTGDTLQDILRVRYGMENAALELYRESGGKVYIVKADRPYLLKLIGSAFSENAKRSADIMRYLEDNGFPVPKTVPTRSGDPIADVMVEGKAQKIVVQEYIDGQEPDLEKTAEKVGELSGKLHNLLDRYPGETITRGRYFFIDKYLELLRRKNCLQLSAYEELGDRLWEKVKDLPQGNCHGDLHRGNLLEDAQGKIWFLDFDTVSRSQTMFDVAVACDMTDYFRLKQKDIEITKDVYTRFLPGYGKQRSLSREEILSFPYWVAIRHFQLQAIIMEIYGLNCNDDSFDDAQLRWLNKWLEITENDSFFN